MTASRLQNQTDHLNQVLKDLANVVKAHDVVHPDRDECGGVGGCRLMMTEHEAGCDVVDTISGLASRGLVPAASISPRGQS